MINVDPYFQGYNDFNLGVLEDECPYRYGSDEFYQWCAGWEDAYHDCPNDDYDYDE